MALISQTGVIGLEVLDTPTVSANIAIKEAIEGALAGLESKKVLCFGLAVLLSIDENGDTKVNASIPVAFAHEGVEEGVYPADQVNVEVFSSFDQPNIQDANGFVDQQLGDYLDTKQDKVFVGVSAAHGHTVNGFGTIRVVLHGQ